MFALRSAPDYSFCIFSVSFVFLNCLLFCVISTVLWGGATSICDGIIFVGGHTVTTTRVFQEVLVDLKLTIVEVQQKYCSQLCNEIC